MFSRDKGLEVLSFKSTYYLYSWRMRGLISKRSQKALGLVSSLVSFLLHAHENVSQFYAFHFTCGFFLMQLTSYNCDDNQQQLTNRCQREHAHPKKYWWPIASKFNGKRWYVTLCRTVTSHKNSTGKGGNGHHHHHHKSRRQSHKVCFI